jgi:alpha-1,3-rhamnosyl/mannosyltransferase
MSRAVARERFDVFFFPSVYSYFPLIRPVRTLVGVHDTIAEHYPEHAFASRRQERFWRMKVRLALFQADRCLTVSPYSKRCIQEVYRFPADKIDVVPEAASRLFSPGGEMREDFILYVGGISPSKNLGALIEAFSGLQNRNEATRLVLVGDFRGDRFQSCYEEIHRQVETLGLGSRVDFLGYVPDEELVELYRKARLFVMPSFDEGFGLPALEAMACGAPVVVSAGNALQELVGDAGLAVNAQDREALRTAMDRILGDERLAADLSWGGVARAKRLSWEQTALGVIRSLRATMVG